MAEEVKIVRSKRDSDAVWYKNYIPDNGPFTSTAHDQQSDVLAGRHDKVHGRHFAFGPTQVQNMFEKRDTGIISNEFSSHDHRHSVEANGFYNDFDGFRLFGKRNVRELDKRLHHSETDFLKHYDRQPVIGCYESTNTQAHQAFKPLFPTTYRRFPKLYGVPKSGMTELQNNVTKWVGSELDYKPAKPGTEQLGQQQWKFFPVGDHSPKKQWHYAYHSAAIR